MVFKYIELRLSPPKAGGRTMQGLSQPSIMRDQALSSCGSGEAVEDMASQEAVELLVARA